MNDEELKQACIEWTNWMRSKWNELSEHSNLHTIRHDEYGWEVHYSDKSAICPYCNSILER